MPEEPDVSPEELEILDRVWRKRIEAKKQQREREAGQQTLIAEQILAALKSRPKGMTWPEIRALFGTKQSDELIKQVLLTLMKTSLATKVQKTEEHAGERFLLAS